MTTFDVARFEALRGERALALGAPLSAVAVTGSTNDDALAAAKLGAAHGALFVADEQTRGRGRRGHGWSSPPGENLTFSIVLRPDLEVSRWSALTLAVGLAVRDVAAARLPREVEVTLKWPNDVLATGKKLCGILVESQIGGELPGALVVGVGLNVAMRELPPEIAHVATSFALLGAVVPEREELLVDLLAALDARVAAYVRQGLTALLPELRRHDALCGRRVSVDGDAGVARGIDECGALLLERDLDGRVIALTAGTVQRL